MGTNINFNNILGISKGCSILLASTTPSLLLDTYTGAAVAYSLRQLRTAYTGAAIRVRRSSDNAEQDIGFVGNNLDTASLLTFCGAGNGFVTTWYDQSTNGKNATQAASANQPRIVNGGSVILENGKPAVDFDGINDFLSNTSFDASSAAAMSNIRVYSTNDAADADTGGYFFGFGNSTNTSNFIGSGGLTGSFSGEYIAFTFSKTGQTNWRLGSTTYRRNSNEQVLEFDNWLSSGFDTYKNSNVINLDLANGWSTTTDSRPELITTNRFSLGALFRVSAASFQQQKAQEYIFWFSNQSSNRTAIETNINSHYNIYP
jgi:hypothetical protein